jgi:hypothetical protein
MHRQQHEVPLYSTIYNAVRTRQFLGWHLSYRPSDPLRKIVSFCLFHGYTNELTRSARGNHQRTHCRYCDPRRGLAALHNCHRRRYRRSRRCRRHNRSTAVTRTGASVNDIWRHISCATHCAGSIGKLQQLLYEPADFIQQLSVQVRL